MGKTANEDASRYIKRARVWPADATKHTTQLVTGKSRDETPVAIQGGRRTTEVLDVLEPGSE